MSALAESLPCLMASQMEQWTPKAAFAQTVELVATLCGAAAATLTLLLCNGVVTAIASRLTLQHEVFRSMGSGAGQSPSV